MEQIEWTAPEYIHTEKTTDWYWIVMIIGISIAIISIIMNNVIFAVLIIVSCVTLALFASRPPGSIRVKINNKGVQMGNILYPYTQLISFWVIPDGRHPKVILKTKKTFMPYINILLADTDPDEVKDVLDNYIPEEEHVELFLEKLMIHLGF